MTDKDLQLIRDLIEEAISEFHCPPCEEDEWLTTEQTTKGPEASASPRYAGCAGGVKSAPCASAKGTAINCPDGHKSSPTMLHLIS